MATVRDLIKGSMRLIEAIATGETPSADEQADALVVLNDMVESWSTEGLLVYGKVREEFTLVPSTGSYTIGTGGTFNTSRPMRIENAAVEIQATDPYEVPIYIMNFDEWANVGFKSETSSYPLRLYYDDTFPLGTVNLWPVPSAAEKLVLYSWKPFSAFASANSDVSFPPGYAKALRYNLAKELAPEYGKAVRPEVMMEAVEAKAAIKRMNIKPQYLVSDESERSRRTGLDILSGE